MKADLFRISAVGLVLILASCAGGGTPKPAGTPLAQNATCVPTSGTQISPREPGYSSVGRCYTKTEIDRTGATTAANALRLLDTAVTIQH